MFTTTLEQNYESFQKRQELFAEWYEAYLQFTGIALFYQYLPSP